MASHSGWWRYPAVGFLLAACALTRTAGFAVPVLFLLFLLLRRTGWRAAAAFLAALLAPLLGYLLWYHQAHGVYGFNQAQGRFLWARTTSFVDCDRLKPATAGRRLCPPGPVDKRLQPDNYLWEGPSAPMYRNAGVDPVYGEVARAAIVSQPVGYARTVLRDTYHFFDPGWRMPGRTACVTARWRLPAGRSGLPSCRPKSAADGFDAVVYGPDGGFRPTANPPAGLSATPLRRLLHLYSNTVALPRLALLLAGTCAAILAAWRPRRLGGPGAGGLLMLSCGFVLIVAAIATSTVDPRYGVPALCLIPPGAALVCWQVLRPRPGTRRHPPRTS